VLALAVNRLVYILGFNGGFFDMNTQLAKAIIDSGMASYEVAQKARIHAVNFSRILRGRQQPSLEAAIRICGVLGVTVEQVFGRYSEKPAIEVGE
jgi:DNA-binding XRE family transcriptional regulator